MRLTVVGCSGSVPSARSATSCYLLEAENFRLVVDLGSGALGPLQRYTAVSQIDAVALSHLHADHFIDLCSLWVARKYRAEGTLPRLPVYGAAEAARRVSQANDDPDVSGVYDFVALARPLPRADQAGPVGRRAGVRGGLSRAARPSAGPAPVR